MTVTCLTKICVLSFLSTLLKIAEGIHNTLQHNQQVPHGPSSTLPESVIYLNAGDAKPVFHKQYTIPHVYHSPLFTLSSPENYPCYLLLHHNITINLFGPLPTSSKGFNYVLITTDIATWFTFLFPVHVKTSKDVTSTFYHFVSDFGLPKILQ
ncbi:hypothetical protein QOT17_006959 [Balamuthia mandrillaris]